MQVITRIRPEAINIWGTKVIKYPMFLCDFDYTAFKLLKTGRNSGGEGDKSVQCCQQYC